MKPEQFHAGCLPRAEVLKQLEKDAAKLEGTDKRVLFCFTCDPYQPDNDEHGLTRQALEICNAHRVPWQVLTKGGTRACPDFDLYAYGAGEFGTTLSMLSDGLREKWEPNAASVWDRVEAIHEAHRCGIRAWVSVEPVIDPDNAYRVIEELSGVVDEFRVGKLNHHAAGKAVDWKQFAVRVRNLLEQSGADYLIKDALFAYLPPGSIQRRQRVLVA
jgi:DNA repair photolyase